jgi:prepilin peptidase CpaA
VSGTAEQSAVVQATRRAGSDRRGRILAPAGVAARSNREGEHAGRLGLLDALVRTPLGDFSGGSWMIGWWTALAAVVVAAAIDWRTRKIPNLLTFPVALAAILANAAFGGWMGGAAALVGLVFGLCIFLLLMLVGAMGPGDVKLMAALGALLGVVNVFWIGLFTCLVGGLLAILYSVGKGSLPRLLRRTWEMLKFMLFTHRLPKAEELGATREDYMPYALAIALGVIVQFKLRRGGS